MRVVKSSFASHELYLDGLLALLDAHKTDLFNVLLYRLVVINLASSGSMAA